ncbi:MAG: multidrug resistance efflux pump [Saprospiraceae bacterium]|jgi:multidrug resistance efflux pump
MLCMLVYMTLTIQSESAFFYGFAENKQTEISHNRNVLVSKIHVNNGQEIKAGDLLLEVIDEEIDFKIGKLEIERTAVDVNSESKIQEINNKINQIQTSRNAEIVELKSDIIELDREIALNKSLYEGLKTIHNIKEYKSPDIVKLNYLKESLSNVELALQREVREQQQLLNRITQPGKLKSKSIIAELDHYKMIEEHLSIYAPFDGLVGTISCKEGENISSYSSLLDLYKHNPTQVKGFVHESMILEVAIGDKLEVASTLHPNIKVEGEVIGLGSRIVEIPERLRKMADFKTYGREIVIEIPADNRFLQKEKVLLNISNPSQKKSTFGGLFSSKSGDSRAFAKPNEKID